MGTIEYKDKANAHDLRFWSQVQQELSELYDLAIDLDQIIEMAPEGSRLMSPHQVASQIIYQLFI
jgi:hypothetical protein